jgi:hypothetical protein
LLWEPPYWSGMPVLLPPPCLSPPCFHCSLLLRVEERDGRWAGCAGTPAGNSRNSQPRKADSAGAAGNEARWIAAAGSLAHSSRHCTGGGEWSSWQRTEGGDGISQGRTGRGECISRRRTGRGKWSSQWRTEGREGTGGSRRCAGGERKKPPPCSHGSSEEGDAEPAPS